MVWILLGCLLVSGTVVVGFFWAIDHGYQVLQRAPALAGSRVWKHKPGKEAYIESLGSLSSFDDYMAEWHVS